MTEQGQSKTNMNIEPVIGEYAFWSSIMASTNDSDIKYAMVQTESGERPVEFHYSSSRNEKNNVVWNRGIIVKIIDKNFINKSYPPKVGEYAYFDARNKRETNTKNISTSEWLISTAGSNYLGCHYSMTYNMPSRHYVTSHGKITEVLKKIN